MKALSSVEEEYNNMQISFVYLFLKTKAKSFLAIIKQVIRTMDLTELLI